MLIALLAWTCSATSRPKGHKALAKKAAPNFNKGLAKNAGAASAIAEDLAKSQLSAVVAPPSCDGPCVRALSSDFDLRHAFTSGVVSSALWSESVRGRGQHDSRLSSQLRLYCNASGSTLEFMENKCLAQGLLLKLGLVSPEANLYCAFKDRAVGGWPAFKPSALVRALKRVENKRAPPSWVLKSATDQASSNVLVMTPAKWKRDGWNKSCVVAYAADILVQPTMDERCATTAGHERRSVQVQRKYPAAKAPKAGAFWFELDANVIWGRLASCRVTLRKSDDTPKLTRVHEEARLWFYFDESGNLSLPVGGSQLAGTSFMKVPKKALQRVVSTLQQAAPRLQRIARDVSRLFGADLWRLDCFVSDEAPLHINELTYPSFTQDFAADLARLRAGYEQLGGAIKPVPAGCVMRALDRLTPGAVTRRPNVDAAACSPYQRHSLDALSVAALKTIDAQFAASKRGTVGGLLGRIFG